MCFRLLFVQNFANSRFNGEKTLKKSHQLALLSVIIVLGYSHLIISPPTVRSLFNQTPSFVPSNVKRLFAFHPPLLRLPVNKSTKVRALLRLRLRIYLFPSFSRLTGVNLLRIIF